MDLFKRPAAIALICLLALALCLPAAAQESASVATLCADFSCGDAEGEAHGLVERFELGYDGDLSVFLLADGLSALTGLDFTVNRAEIDGESAVVDWSGASTLVAGLDDREQKVEFFFYDVDSLSWFMMDSLALTIRENLGVAEVFYTMDGGTLVLEHLSGINQFPSDIPYMGSAFYLAHMADSSALAQDSAPVMPLSTPVFEATVPFDAIALSPLDAERNLSGGYLAESISEDGTVRITNASIPNADAQFDTLEESIAEYVATLCGDEAVWDMVALADETYSAALSYPAYLTSWITGENEDTREHVALIALTDTHCLLYAFSISADFYADYADQLGPVFDGLIVRDLS